MNKRNPKSRETVKAILQDGAAAFSPCIPTEPRSAVPAMPCPSGLRAYFMAMARRFYRLSCGQSI